MSKVRIWIAGPRVWENPDPIEYVIKKLIANYGVARLLIGHGRATGVDTHADDICYAECVHTFAVRACWPVGRRAGPVRNEVIAAEFQPQLLVAFHYWELEGTYHKGTRSAIQKARKYSIPVKTIHVDIGKAMPSSVSKEAPGSQARRDAKRRKRAGRKAKETATDA